MAFGNLTVNQGTNQGILVDQAGTSDIGVVKLDLSGAGTYGTLWNGAVTVGTMPNIPGGTLNLGTITGNVGVSSGTINVSTISSMPNIPGGTFNLGTVTGNLGTIGTIGLATITGNVGISSGTINVSTISSMPNIPGGTINLGTITGNLGTMGTLGTVSNLGSFTNGGTIKEVTTVANLSNGTLGTMGTLGLVNTVTTVTTVSNLTNGSIKVTAGTEIITGGSIAVTAGTINTGTINLGTFVGKDANAAAQTGNPISVGGTDGGGTVYTFKTDTKGQMYLGGGTVGMLNAGTISTLPNLPGGSIAVTAGTQNVGTVNTGTINTGTINTGTINAGTIQINPLPATNTISHVGTSGTLGIGTLITSASVGAGTAVYITRYSILVLSGTLEVALAFGTQVNGPQVIAHGVFPAGGGIAMPVNFPHGFGTTNSPLTYQIIGGAGTATWDVDYFFHT